MAESSPAKTVRARALTADDQDRAIACLSRHFPERDEHYWRRGWTRLAQRPQTPDRSPFGYCLDAGGAVVGVLLLIISAHGEGAVAAANLSSWCVDLPYRAFAGALVAASTRDKRMAYVNISPAPHTQAGIRAQGYEPYNSGQFLFTPGLSRRAGGARARMFAPDDPWAVFLPAFERTLLLEHAKLGCKCFIVASGEDAFGFVTVDERILRLSVRCEQIAYCRDLATLAKFAGVIGRDLRAALAPLMIVDALGALPGLVGIFLAGRGLKFSKGPQPPSLGDLSYTELVYLGR